MSAADKRKAKYMFPVLTPQYGQGKSRFTSTVEQKLQKGCPHLNMELTMSFWHMEHTFLPFHLSGTGMGLKGTSSTRRGMVTTLCPRS